MTGWKLQNKMDMLIKTEVTSSALRSQVKIVLMLVCTSILFTRGCCVVSRTHHSSQQVVKLQSGLSQEHDGPIHPGQYPESHNYKDQIWSDKVAKKIRQNRVTSTSDKFTKLLRELKEKRLRRDAKKASNVKHGSQNQTAKLDVTSYTFYGDTHRTALISWTHEDSKVMFVVTCDSTVRKDGHSNCQSKSNLYRSIDYGETFALENVKFQTSSGSWVSSASVSPIDRNIVIVTDIGSQIVYYSINEGESYNAVKVPFHPDSIIFHPVLKDYILAHDKTSKSLYVSETHGQNWILVHTNVRKYFWAQTDVDLDIRTIFLEIETYIPVAGIETNISLIFTASRPYGGQVNILDKDLGSVSPYSLFIEKEYILVQRYLSTGDSKLYVSYKRKFPFKECKFPSPTSQLHYFVIDASHQEIVLAVLHQTHTNLYISDEEGKHFSLTLRDVASSDEESWNSGLPVVDVHKVAGLQGTYIANHRLTGTLISYDKGGRWFPLKAPDFDINGKPTTCKVPDCSLHLKLYFGRFFVGISSVLSKKTAPGLIIAEGVIGTKPQINGLTSGGVYLSNDGGKSWKQVLQGIYAFTFADQGGVVSAVPLYRWLDRDGSIDYSCTEGNNWQSATISKTPVLLIGMVTQNSAKSNIVSVFGRYFIKSTTFQWTVWKVNFSSIFPSKCIASDYILWSPAETHHKGQCLLGEHFVYEKRKRNTCCYNGIDYERPLNITTCNCTMEDFVCDFNYYRKQPASLCFPSKPDFHIHPPNCKEGSYYIESKGYRKVIGNKCIGGVEKELIPERVPCPPQPPVDLYLSATKYSVSVNEQVSFTLQQKRGFYHTKYSWNFGYNQTNENNISSFNLARHRTYIYKVHGEYLVSVTAVNEAGTYTVKTVIRVIDRVLNASLLVPLNVIAGESALYTVSLDRPGQASKQEHGFIHFVWIFKPGSTPVLSLNSSVKHTYQKSGIYEIEVQVFNAISISTATSAVHVHQDVRILKLGFSAALDFYNKHTGKWRVLFEAIIENYMIEKFRIEKDMIKVCVPPDVPTVAIVSLVQDTDPNAKLSHYYEYTIDDIKASIVDTINTKHPSIFLAGKEVRILSVTVMRDKKLSAKPVKDTAKETLTLVFSISGSVLFLGIIFAVFHYLYRSRQRRGIQYQCLVTNAEQCVPESANFEDNLDTEGNRL